MRERVREGEKQRDIRIMEREKERERPSERKEEKRKSAGRSN